MALMPTGLSTQGAPSSRSSVSHLPHGYFLREAVNPIPVKLLTVKL